MQPDQPLDPPQQPPQTLGQQMPKRRRWWIIPAAIIVLLVALAVGAFAWYTTNLSPKDPHGQQKLFSIKEGDTADDIAGRLYSEGFIKNELAFKIALRLTDKAANIKAGQYRISPAEDVHAILAKLESGEADISLVSFIPGKTLTDVKKALTDAGYEASAVEAALTKQYDHPILEDKPASASLEGYIYPDSYEVDTTQSPEVVIEKALDNFWQKMQQNGLSSASFKPMGLNLYQAITLGSIVEKEVSVVTDRPIVAQVFLKRLETDMSLGSDATFVYAANQLGVPPAVDIDSPYNTRVHKGLPPGPISNMTIDALTAVAKPSKTQYLYFVTGDDNVTHFAETGVEHDQNIEKYCGVKCEL